MIRKARFATMAQFDARLDATRKRLHYVTDADMLRHLNPDGPSVTAGLAVDLTRYTPFAHVLEPHETPPVLSSLVGRTAAGPVPGFGTCVVHTNGIPLYVFCYLDYRNRLRALLPYNQNPFNRLARRPFGQTPLDDAIASEQYGFASYDALKTHAKTDGSCLYDVTELTNALHHFVRLDDVKRR